MSEGPRRAQRRELERLLLEHLGALHAFALRLAGDAGQAAELVEEAARRAHRSWDRPPAEAGLRPWLFGQLASARRESASAGPTAPPSRNRADEPASSYEALLAETGIGRLPSPEEALAGLVTPRDVEQALGELPEELRGVVHLCLLEGLGYEEAGRALELPADAVAERLRDGRLHAQAQLLRLARDRGLVAGEDADGSAESARSPS